MDYMEVFNDVIDFVNENYTVVVCVGVFIIIVIIGYFADKRRARKKMKNVQVQTPAVKEETIKSDNLPAVEEIKMPVLEPAIDITPEPELEPIKYESSYNDFKSIESPFTVEKFNEDKVDVKTMSATVSDVPTEIDNIFKDFNFEEETEPEAEPVIEETPEPVEEKPLENIEEEPVGPQDIEVKEEEVDDLEVDNDMDYDDIKPDKSIYDEIKPLANEQDHINNLF